MDKPAVKKCKHCNAEFATKSAPGRPRSYCSHQCKVDEGNSCRIDRENQTCDQCGCVFSYKRIKKYCSSECALASREKRRTELVQQNKARLVCCFCQDSFSATTYRKYCTKACRESSMRDRLTVQKQNKKSYKCRGCKCTFYPRSQQYAKYCSRECAYKNYKQWLGKRALLIDSNPVEYVRSKLKGWSTPICPQFGTKVNHSGQFSERAKRIKRIINGQEAVRYAVTCNTCGEFWAKNTNESNADCQECRRKMHRRNSKRNSSANHRQRAREYGVEYQSFSKRSVFLADRYKCQLCGITCRKSLPKGQHYHDELATLDHIIPLCKGGSHTRNNAWTLCWGCNCIKGDATPIIWSDHPGTRVNAHLWPAHVEQLKERNHYDPRGYKLYKRGLPFGGRCLDEPSGPTLRRARGCQGGRGGLEIDEVAREDRLSPVNEIDTR